MSKKSVKEKLDRNGFIYTDVGNIRISAWKNDKLCAKSRVSARDRENNKKLVREKLTNCPASVFNSWVKEFSEEGNE